MNRNLIFQANLSLQAQAPTPIPPAKGTIRLVILLVSLFLFAVMSIVIVVSMGHSLLGQVKDMTEMHFKSQSDKFRVTILEMKSEPGNFRERVRVTCEREMNAGIWVTDLKKAGLFEVDGPGGEKFYREGHPYQAGQSSPVRASGDSSTCDILFTVRTTATNTMWESRMSSTVASAFSNGQNSDGVKTTFGTPMTVSGVQTNWAGSYERGSALPLASLGDYKILLIIK